MKLVYGIFSDLGSASIARDLLQERAAQLDEEQEVASVAIHQHEVVPNELPRSGTIIWRAALGGAVLVGGVVGLVLILLTTNMCMHVDRPGIVGGVDVFFVLPILAAAAFGGILAAIAGRAGNRARVRQLEKLIAGDKVMLTLSALDEEVQPIHAMMTQAGALQTGTI